MTRAKCAGWLVLSWSLCFGAARLARAEGAPPILGTWQTEDGKGVIQMRIASDGTLEGVGAPGKGADPERRDPNNPDPALRQRSLAGARILWGFRRDDDDGTSWSAGHIYDPDNGKTYACKMKLDGDSLRIRGYVGISLFGRTTVWKRLVDVPPANP